MNTDTKGNIPEQLRTRLFTRLEAYADLAAQLTDDLLNQRVDVPKHKSLSEHLWCVVGARESYAKALALGSWQGFNCSMKAFSAVDFRAKLSESSANVREVVLAIDNWSDTQIELFISLNEHEVMHEGQIIRHMYALDRHLPESWV